MTRLSDLATLWPPEEQATAVAVALAESGGRLDAAKVDDVEASYGPWQVNTRAWPQFDPQRLVTDPWYSAQAAYQVWAIQGWRAWTTYTNGSYRRFLGQDADVGDGLTEAGVAPGPAAPEASAAPAGLSTLAPLLVILAALWALEVI